MSSHCSTATCWWPNKRKAQNDTVRASMPGSFKQWISSWDGSKACEFMGYIFNLYTNYTLFHVVFYISIYHAIWQQFLMGLFINSTKAAFLCIVCPVWKRHAPPEELSTVLVFLKKLLSGLEKSISTQALGQLTIDLYITFWKHVHPSSFSILVTLTPIGSHLPCLEYLGLLHRGRGPNINIRRSKRLGWRHLKGGNSWLSFSGSFCYHPEFESHGEFGHDPCISCWAWPSGTNKNSAQVLLEQEGRAYFSCYYAQYVQHCIHFIYSCPLYLNSLMDFCSADSLFILDHIQSKPLCWKMLYLWLATQVSYSQGFFQKCFALFCMFPSELTSSAWSNCLPSGDCCGRHKHRNRSNMLQVWICAGRSSDRNSVIKKGIIMIIIIIRVRTLTKILLKS